MKKIILVIFIILIVMSMPMMVLADDEGEQTEGGTFYWYSLKDFWENYKPEDVGYYVLDNMEKIYVLGSEEPLEIKIVKEGNDSSPLDHFIGLTVNWVYSTYDPTIIYSEEIESPEYEVTEEDGVLTFTFNKDNLKTLEDFQRYEFLFTFNDGRAYSLVWATENGDKLYYTEGGHVFEKYPEEPPLEKMGVYGPTQAGETTADEGYVELITENYAEEVPETNNYSIPILLACVAAAVFAVFMAYRLKVRNKR